MMTVAWREDLSSLCVGRVGVSQMDAVPVRAAFRCYVGEEKFRKFVRTVNTWQRDRLPYWLEQLWRRFSSEHPMMELSVASLREIFRFCEVHDCELEQDTIPIRYGLFCFPPEYIEARDRLFPYARTVACIDDGFRSDRTAMEVSYCPLCRRELASSKRWSRW